MSHTEVNLTPNRFRLFSAIPRAQIFPSTSLPDGVCYLATLSSTRFTDGNCKVDQRMMPPMKCIKQTDHVLIAVAAKKPL